MKFLDQFSRFAAVGIIGFIVDGGILWMLVSDGANPYLSRAVSFPVAVISTWLLNRTWTFAGSDKSRPRRQFNRYFTVQTIGALSNFVVYSALLGVIEPTPLNALIALAAGSFVGMFINFAGSWRFVFRRG